MARAGLALTVVTAAGVGFVVAQRPALGAITVVLALLVVVLARRPALLAAASVPGVLLVFRTAGDAISVAQVLGALAAFLAVLALSRDRLPSRYWTVLGLAGLYLLTIAVIVLLHPTAAAVENWALRGNVLVGGMLVGAWLVRSTMLRPALVVYSAAVAVLGLANTVEGILIGFEPAGVAGYHKNYVGAVCAASLLILIAGGSVHRLPRRWVVLFAIPTFTGLLASQSRGGMISLAIGLIVWALVERVPGSSRRVAAALLVGGVAAAVAIQVTLVQVRLRDDLAITSTEVRQLVTEETLALWRDNPWLGVGLRFHVDPEYRTPVLDNGASNVFVEALGEGGLLALVALLVLVAGVALALVKARTALAALALSLFVARFVHGTVDIYWTYVTTFVPWVLVGAALAADPDQPGDGDQEEERASRRPVTGTMGSAGSPSTSRPVSVFEP